MTRLRGLRPRERMAALMDPRVFNVLSAEHRKAIADSLLAESGVSRIGSIRRKPVRRWARLRGLIDWLKRR